MVSLMDMNQKIGIIGPKLLAGDGTIQRMCARKFNDFWDWLKLSLFGGRRFSLKRNHVDKSEFEIDQEVDCISGACMVIRRDIIHEERIFDPIFFMYGEDVDLCYTTVHRGWKVFSVEIQALVTHYGGESSKQEPSTVQYDMDAAFNLAVKRYGKLAGNVFRFLNLTIWLLIPSLPK